MLTADEARQLAREWRDRFTDGAAFETSWTRFFDMVGDPTRTKLEAWLAKDLSKDEIRNAGIVKEPLLPVRQGYQLTDCRHCEGKRYVRRDVDIDHPDFGKAHPCPACNRRG